jgi:hypothetical protein
VLRGAASLSFGEVFEICIIGRTELYLPRGFKTKHPLPVSRERVMEHQSNSEKAYGLTMRLRASVFAGAKP